MVESHSHGELLMKWLAKETDAGRRQYLEALLACRPTVSKDADTEERAETQAREEVLETAIAIENLAEMAANEPLLGIAIAIENTLRDAPV